MIDDTKIQLNYLSVDGGASSNNYLMQFQSDIVSTKIIRPEVVETTSLGAAFLVGITSGYFLDLEDIKKITFSSDVFNPKMNVEKRNIKIMKRKILKMKIIYEDEDVIVVDKPSGLITIKDEKTPVEATLYHQVYEHVKKQNGRIFIVHRLDKDTSGLVIFAKNADITSKTI